MKYNIGAITDAGDVKIVNSPEIGAESRVSVSYDPWKIIGEIEQRAADSGTYNVEPGFAFESEGLDIQIVSKKAIRSDVELVVTLNVTLADNTVTTAVATFGQQSFRKDDSNNRGQFSAVDLIPQGGGNTLKKVKAIAGIASVVGGKSGNLFSIVSLPEEDSYHRISCKTSFDAQMPYSKSLAIACGYDGSEHVKRGRSDAGSLTVEAKYYSGEDGLPRLAGHVVTILEETFKEDLVLNERTIIGGWRPEPQAPRGDGDDEVTATAEGMFSDVAVFTI